MFNGTIFSLGQLCTEMGDVFQTLVRQILVFILGASSSMAAAPNLPDQFCAFLNFQNFPNNLMKLLPF
ncbi:MAG: hypothetical protein U1A27_06115 [Phycisphaerae bacterium]